MKLIGMVGSSRVTACLMVFENLSVEYQVEWLEPQDLKSSKLVTLNPQGKVPVLVTPDDGIILETTTICRYLARKYSKLLGNCSKHQLLVDQWLSFIDSEINESAGLLAVQLNGIPLPQGHKLPDPEFLRGNLFKKLIFVNNHLLYNTYLIGDELTLADYVFICLIYKLFAFSFDEKRRKELPNITRYIENLIQRPEVRKYFGRLRYAQEPFKAPKIEAPKPAPVEKKPAAPKEEKKAQKHEEDEIAEPKPKEPVFPETSFNLMNFKTFFINEKNFDVALDGFWKDYKEGEWSLWHLKYLKYPGECEIVYRTNNLLRTFLSRLENIRKYIFGTHFVLGDEPSLEIEGLWLIRGSELFEGITEIDVYDTYKWTKLDTTKDETKAMVRDFWTNRKEDEEKVAGMTIRTFKWIK